MAVDEDGQTLGMAAMSWRSRPDKHVTESGPRPPHERESQMWLDVMESTTLDFSLEAPETILWFQLDAGADHSRNFLKAFELGHHVTIRCAHNRRIEAFDGPQKLFSEVSRQRPMGRMYVERKVHGRKTRRARLSVRACRVTVSMNPKGRERELVDLWCVKIQELGKPPKGQEPISWTLLTTYQVDELDDALEVVKGYTMRWRIEDFYRTWKKGHCRLEDSQLRSEGAILRWSIILATVAARIERIKHRSRNEPNAHSSEEFSREEIDATLMLSKTTKWKVGDDPQLGDFVELLAQLGGYTGKSSGGPPGAVTIARGLDWVTPAAMILRQTREESD